MNPRADQDRSPAARRYDPPLRKARWTISRPMGLESFLDDARGRWPGDQASFQRLLWHGGLHIGGRPLLLDAPPPRIGPTWVVAYGFRWEPEAVAICDESVLLDEAGVVAVHKPPWITMQGSRASQRLSLERRLRDLLRCPSLVAAHRLDRQTSGVALFARDREAAAWLGREFREGRVRKRYLAVVSPAPESERFEVAGRLRRDAHPERFRFTLDRPDAAAEAGSRPSLTCFQRLRVEGQRALVCAEPRTGRTHQIRVHLAAAGCPIVGDDLYGASWQEGRPWSADRVQLHAARLDLRLPGPRPRSVRLEVAPPGDVGPPTALPGDVSGDPG